MTLLEATAERLFELILIGGVGLAVVVYIIRKQLRNPQNDPVTVIGLWVLSFVVFFGITYSAIAAQEGFALIFVLLVAVPAAVPGPSQFDAGAAHGLARRRRAPHPAPDGAGHVRGVGEPDQSAAGPPWGSCRWR